MYTVRIKSLKKAVASDKIHVKKQTNRFGEKINSTYMFNNQRIARLRNGPSREALATLAVIN